MYDLETIFFELSKEIIDVLDHKRKYSSLYHFIKRDPKPQDIGIVMMSIGQQIGLCYKRTNGEELLRIGQAIQPVFLEALKNSILHGPQKGVFAGLFVGEQGACYGFKDFGDYFKNTNVKRSWESKTLIRSTNGKQPSYIDGGYGFGDEMIYEYSDRIYVDCKQGVLYCFQAKKRLFEIAPIPD